MSAARILAELTQAKGRFGILPVFLLLLLKRKQAGPDQIADGPA
jgi:hypothetical protein